MEQPEHTNPDPAAGDPSAKVRYLRPSQGDTTAWERFQADLQRYYRMSGATTRLARWRVALGTEGIWAIALYRYGQYLRNEAPHPVQLLLRIPYDLAHRLLEMAVGIHLFPQTEIGPGLYVGHYGGIWISPNAVLGANCNINHHVTIGAAGKGRAAPRLGDCVWVGPGAVISGPIRVESEVVVGANSLVTTNVPKGALVLGVPAKVLGFTGSGKLVEQAAG